MEYNEAVSLLYKEGYSCVVVNGDEMKTFSQSGIMDLYELQSDGEGFLQGAFLADKVIGKAAAVLALRGGVVGLYADVISVSALELLHSRGVEVKYAHIVNHILKRDRSDKCPLESACDSVDDTEQIFEIIKEFIKRKKNIIK